MDLDKMLRDDRCRGMNEVLTFEPDLDYSPESGCRKRIAVSDIVYELHATGNFTSGNFFAPPWF